MKLICLKEIGLCLLFQDHEETSMEGVQICGVNNNSSPSQREDNKYPLKFGESVVNVLHFHSLRQWHCFIHRHHYFIVKFCRSDQGYKVCLTDIEPVIYKCYTENIQRQHALRKIKKIKKLKFKRI
jgi:hypothetical protein